MFYGCESWVVPQSQADNIDGSHRALLCAAINIRWPEIIRNTDLYTRIGDLPASTLMREKCLIQFGEAVRAEPLERPIFRVLRHQPMEGYRRRGMPPKTMWNVLEEDFGQLYLSLPGEWKRQST